MPASLHEKIIQQLKTLGYQANDRGGVCYGIACMAVQAILADDLETFDNRIKFLASYKDARHLRHDISMAKQKITTIQPLNEKVKQALDAQAFFDGIELYYQPTKYKNYLYNPTYQQSFFKVAPTVFPSSILNQVDKLASFQFTNTYNDKQLEKLLQKLEKNLKKQKAALPILISANNHAITICYQPSVGWILIDPNQLPSKVIGDASDISKRIFAAFNLRGEIHQKLPMDINLITLNNLKDAAIKKIVAIQKDDIAHIDLPSVNAILPLFKNKYSNLSKLIASQGNLKAIKHIVKNDTNSENMASLVTYAIINGHTDIFQYLFMKYFKENKLTQASFMNVACCHGNNEIVDWLIRFDASLVDRETEELASNNKKPLLAAIATKHDSIIALLLSKNAQVDIVNNTRQTPLLMAASSGNLTLVKKLLEKGANIHAVDDDQHGLMTHAALSGNLSLVKHLVHHYPLLNLNPQNANNTHCLITLLLTGVSASKSKTKKHHIIAEYLLEKGAIVTNENVQFLQRSMHLTLNREEAIANDLPNLAKLLKKRTKSPHTQHSLLSHPPPPNNEKLPHRNRQKKT